MRNDITLGIKAMRQMDGLDIGQGLVIQAGRILAMKGRGYRCLTGRTASLIDPDATPAIFVKMSKYSQDKTQDAPSFGIRRSGKWRRQAFILPPLKPNNVVIKSSQS